MDMVRGVKKFALLRIFISYKDDGDEDVDNSFKEIYKAT